INSNSQKYQLLGDAATRPNLPQLYTRLTLYDSSGTAPLTTLERGATVTFKGQVLDRAGGTPVTADGVASMLIEDSAPLLDTPPCTCSTLAHTTFYYSAGAMFRGDVSMHGGSFQGRFVVPLEASSGPRAGARG